MDCGTRIQVALRSMHWQLRNINYCVQVWESIQPLAQITDHRPQYNTCCTAQSLHTPSREPKIPKWVVAVSDIHKIQDASEQKAVRDFSENCYRSWCRTPFAIWSHDVGLAHQIRLDNCGNLTQLYGNLQHMHGFATRSWSRIVALVAHQLSTQQSVKNNGLDRSQKL